MSDLRVVPTVAVADTAVLLDEIRAFINRFIVLSSDAQAVAVALWTAHTHALDAADATPYLAVTSAEKRSGKSRLLELLTAIAARGRHTPNISEAALFRVLETVQPTLLIDEVDALFKSGAERTEALRGVINAGNRRGALVYRCEGPKSEVRGFEVFGAKVLGGIDNGALPDTILDRSIIIRLRRKTGADRVERLLWSDVQHQADELRERIETWAQHANGVLRSARPEFPDGLDDRAVEGWWPLFAIADAAGGDWPDAARRAAIKLSGPEVDDESRGARLLADLRDVFGDRRAMLTDELLPALNELDESPWRAWHDGKGITARDLARLLKPYEVKSRSVRTPERPAKGYHRDDLEDPWARYLPPRQEASHAPHGSQPAPDGKPDVTHVSKVTLLSGGAA
jgi:hypothetical protein